MQSLGEARETDVHAVAALCGARRAGLFFKRGEVGEREIFEGVRQRQQKAIFEKKKGLMLRRVRATGKKKKDVFLEPEKEEGRRRREEEVSVEIGLDQGRMKKRPGDPDRRVYSKV